MCERDDSSGVDDAGDDADEIGDDFFADVGDPMVADPADEVALPSAPPRLGLLAQLSASQFDVVARSAKLAFVGSGTDVFAQGDEADRFFILVEGSVEVVRDGEALATLGPGSFFGESALLVRGRRSATVRAIADCALWSVGYEAFEEVVTGALASDAEAQREIAARLQATRPEHFE